MNLKSYKEYLQVKINEKHANYKVWTERNLDSALDGDVILTARSGPLYASSCQIPYEITIITATPEETIDFFTSLFIELNNKVFTTINEEDSTLYNVRQTYQSPTVMDADLSIGSDHFARLVAFSTLFISINVNDIKSLKIDNEYIEYENATLSYVTEQHTNKVSSDITVKSKIKTNTTSISFSMVNKNSVFCNKLNSIMFHRLEANTTFTVEIEMSNGFVGTLVMILAQEALSSAKGMLPGSNINLIEYDGE